MENAITNITNMDAIEVLRKIQQEDLFQTDKILENIQGDSGGPIDYDSLSEDDICELEDILYVWFGPEEYVRSLYEIGALVLSFSVSDFFEIYVSEARQCYAFQQYNAVYSLCRTIIETAIRHKCQRKGIITHRQNISEIIEYKPSELINKVTSGALREMIKEIYRETSSLVHGRKKVDKYEAKNMFKKTLEAVQTIERL